MDDVFRAWELFEHFTPREAAHWWFGIDPCECSCHFDECPAEQTSLTTAIERALATGDIRAEKQTEQGVPLIHRSELAKWALSRTKVPEFLQCGLAELKHKNGIQDSQITQDSIKIAESSCHDFSTPLLELQKQAINKYWRDWKPGTPAPKSKEIISWLMEQDIQGGPVSARTASAIDTIIRPLAAKSGGRSKEDEDYTYNKMLDDIPF